MRMVIYQWRRKECEDIVLSIAQATKSRPQQGQVMAQVKWITKSGTINPRDVDLPGPLIDYVVVSPKQYHWQSGTIEFDPRISYKIYHLLLMLSLIVYLKFL